MSKRCMLTTSDNPISPFDDYVAWNSWDVAAGYHTAEFLGRIVNTSLELSDADYDVAVEQAIDEIVQENVLGIYVKVEKTFDD